MKITDLIKKEAIDLNVKASTIYFKILTFSEVGNEISRINYLKSQIRELDNVKNIDAFISSSLNDEDIYKLKNLKKLFYIDAMGKIKTNPLALDYLEERLQLFNVLKNTENPENCSALIYYSWIFPYKREWHLDKKDIIGETKKNDKKKVAVENFMQLYLDKELLNDSSEQSAFKAKFTELVKKEFGIKVSNNHPVWGKNNINRFLDEQKFDFKIISNKGAWMIISNVGEDKK